MNTRLIIDGNAVYEIDEDCRLPRTADWMQTLWNRVSRTRGRSTPLQKLEPASEKITNSQIKKDVV